MNIKRNEMLVFDPEKAVVTDVGEKPLEDRVAELERANTIMQRQIVDLMGWFHSHDKRFKAISEAAFKVGSLS